MAKNEAQQRIEKILTKAEISALLEIFDNLDAQAKAVVEEAINGVLTISKKAATLEKVKAIVSLSDADTKAWLVKALGDSYIASLNIVTENLQQAVGVGLSEAILSATTITSLEGLVIHKDAVNALLSEAYLDFANGMNGIVSGVERQLNETIKRQVRANLLPARIQGDSIPEIAREITETLGQQGFSVLIDRGGGAWTLNNYAKMLSRTHIIRASNEATINRLTEFGVDIVETSIHGGVIDTICLELQGRLFSLSGKSKEFPKLVDVPPWHPNCGHTLLPRPDLG